MECNSPLPMFFTRHIKRVRYELNAHNSGVGDNAAKDVQTPLGEKQESPSIDCFNSLNVNANQMLMPFYGIIIKT